MTDEDGRGGPSQREDRRCSRPAVRLESAPGVYAESRQRYNSLCVRPADRARGLPQLRTARDSRNAAYSVGPSFTIVEDRLRAGGRTLLHLPTGQWIHFEIAGALGAQNSATWALTITLPGESPQAFAGLKNADRTFEKLTWLGFISTAADKAVFYLDNLEIINQP